MQLSIEHLPPCRIAYIRQTGPYGPANAEAIEQLKAWAEANRLLNESAILLGIPQDNPETTPPEACRYDACIVVAEDVPVAPPMQAGELSGGRYAVFRISHTAEAVQAAWADIFPALHSSGYRLDYRPIIERYSGSMIRDNLCELCVPVLPNE